MCRQPWRSSSWFAPSPMGASAQERPSLELDRSALEQIEDDSESLANQLLDLSVELRRQDLGKAAKYFPEEFEATLFPFGRVPFSTTSNGSAGTAGI